MSRQDKARDGKAGQERWHWHLHRHWEWHVYGHWHLDLHGHVLFLGLSFCLSVFLSKLKKNI